MKFSNTLLLVTATASLAMVAAPAADAFSWANIRLPPWLEEKYAYLKQPQSMAVKNIPVVKNTGAGGWPIKEYAPRRFATGDAPSAVGPPTNTAGTPGPSSPTTRPRRSGHRRRRPRRRNRVRRSSSPGQHRRRRRRRPAGQQRKHGRRHRRPGQRRARGRRQRKPTTAVPTTPAPTGGTATGTAAASLGGAPGGIREWKAAMRQQMREQAAREQAKLEAKKRYEMLTYGRLLSVSDSGYDYEPFDDEYDEGYSLSEDAAFEDAWDDPYDSGEGYSIADEAFEDAWDDTYDGEGFSLEEGFDEELEDAAEYEY
ncbi:hypothetical protein GGF31_005681 [Allomyces arbusculus]|nr:hypothetical protein GGF31_005681 [Allomyces arbusculus]